MPCIEDVLCFYNLQQNQQAIFTNPTGKELQDGPATCSAYNLCWSTKSVVEMKSLKVNEQVLIKNQKDAAKHRYVFGPGLIKLDDPWEYFAGGVEICEILDQDDYIIVRSMDGRKSRLLGPHVWQKKYGDEVDGERRQSIQIPVNHYMIVKDSNNADYPVQHISGPKKLYLTAFQTVEQNPHVQHTNPDIKTKARKEWVNGAWRVIAGQNDMQGYVQDSGAGLLNSRNYFPCIEVTQQRAVHLQLVDGSVVLIASPQYRMPAVGEKVLQYVDRVVLLQTDFCMLKTPDGQIIVKHGKNSDDSSFFLKPFYEFVMFHCDKEVSILSTLPTFMAHNFQVRTKDNIVVDLDLRICYQITSVETFSSNPIENFYPNIKNHVQNKLLDRFAASTLREFMNTFSKIAQASVDQCTAYFMKYGIDIVDVQILNFYCKDIKTQQLLNSEVEVSVVKQNELRATQNDIAIQEKSNEVERRKKDLEVQMFTKDQEVRLEKKQLENTIRIKEMEIEIIEEEKRTELLEVKRGNDLVEAEFAGKAQGHEFEEFVKGIDPKLSAQQKISIWKKQLELEQASQVYSKMGVLNMLPPEEDMSIFRFGTNEHEQEQSLVKTLK